MDEQTTSEFIRIQAALAGRYSLQRELGRGGMGIVYLAQDVALERPVALKVLQPQLASQPALKQRFLNEARTAAKLSHPNIIPIFAVDEVGDIVFFVMAFVDGETLGQRIRSRGPLPASELAKILRDVGWGLAYAHAQGVVHRDVKADNIMIERTSSRALVVDFGIARVVQNIGVTDAGEILGTADYMSPEQASGEVADHRSDIYSLGVVAYYALSGRLPFEAPTVGAMLAKHIAQSPPAIAEAVPGLSTKLGDAVDRCLVKDPARRFASAEELADVVSVALASRREAPRPIQIFTKKASEISQNLLFIGHFQLFSALLGALAAVTQEGLGSNVMFGLAAIGLATWPVLAGGMLGQIRTLLKSGYTRDDLVASWNREFQFDQGDRALEHGRTAGLVERASRWAVPIGWGCIIAATGLGGPFHDAAIWLGASGWTAALLGSVLSLWRHDGRTALSRRVAGWFVKSRLGRWAFRLAGLGLDRSALASLATHRPTELAIGIAVDSLFDALPKATRLELAELPSVVRHLEADAMMIRQRVEQLNDAAAKVGSGMRNAPGRPAADGVIERRDALDRELNVARDAAKQRLADAVTALETIRLDLLRLTAGAGSVGSLTADLTEARAVSEEVGRLLDARDEVETLLSRDSRPKSMGVPATRQTPAPSARGA
ncbi:MAG TPA: protein kinase [Gemmatimonadales bacterium]